MHRGGARIRTALPTGLVLACSQVASVVGAFAGWCVVRTGIDGARDVDKDVDTYLKVRHGMNGGGERDQHAAGEREIEVDKERQRYEYTCIYHESSDNETTGEGEGYESEK